MINKLLAIAQQAGKVVLSVYSQTSFQMMSKSDQSPLTEADTRSHQFIHEQLSMLYPSIPIISEESNAGHAYDIRKNWECFFLIDPLDGTKEFIKRNGEFTINIALVRECKPVMGVIHAPVLDVTYYAEKNHGAHKVTKNDTIKLPIRSQQGNKISVVTSRSHTSSETLTLIERLKAEGKEVSIISAGSALKFGLIADGTADIYPRLAPTMEWDTAAGHIIVNEVGKEVTVMGSGLPLQYNKKELRNPGFIVQ